jgi:organic radical activating enzyme
VWCDTAYTWNWHDTPFEHDRGQKFDREAEAIRLSVAEAAAYAAPLASEGFVITGGEPLMQRAVLPDLIDALKAGAPDALIEIETNGSIAPPPTLVKRVDLFVVSPKLAHSGNDAALALKAEALAAFSASPKGVFKFVARSADDVAAAAAIASEHAIDASRVYIMPEGTEFETLSQRARALTPAILAHGFNFTPRLHIDLFGAVRGV